MCHVEQYQKPGIFSFGTAGLRGLTACESNKRQSSESDSTEHDGMSPKKLKNPLAY